MDDSDRDDRATDESIVYQRKASGRPHRVAESVMTAGYGALPYAQAPEDSLLALYQELGDTLDRMTARVAAITSAVRDVRREIAATHLQDTAC